MTLVEFFDSTPADNLVSALSMTPDRIVFMGEQKAIEKERPRIEEVLRLRFFAGDILIRPFRRGDMEGIMEALAAVVEEFPDCAFDLTGGDELVLFAFGRIFERCRSRDIQVHWFNIRTGRIRDCDLDGQLPDIVKPALTVDENVFLHGGEIIWDGDLPEATHRWRFDREFLDDVSAMWEICRRNHALWNFQTTMLAKLYANRSLTEDELYFEVNVAHVMSLFEDKGVTLNLRGIFPALARAGLITDYDYDSEYFRFRFKNEQVMRCLTKAGTVLELMTYSAAAGLKRRDGSALFTDAMTGVYIDWDGRLHDWWEDEPDAANEIDVILMDGLIPVFISCKNGFFGVSELYKLSAVADRFGRNIARKALVCPSLEDLPDRGAYIRARAAALNVELIDDVHTMDGHALAKQLRHLAT